MKKVWDESTDMGRLLIAARARYPDIKIFADVARHIGVVDAVLTNWKKRGIPANKIFELSEIFSCNPRWLATNEGEMREISSNQFGINLDEVNLKKIKYFKEKIIPMSDEEFLARKELSEQADRVAEIARGKKSGEGENGGNNK